jgi:ABC-type cobalamin transport system ATPase subunit
MQAISTKIIEQAAVDGLLFATHDVRTVARHADRVLVLEGGRLLADCTREELLADDQLLAAARLRRTPLFELRQRLRLHGWTAEGLAEELSR